ncbi:membrane protein insertion efficiency factor YidD [Yaniella flava]|uniref:membrane protein insertion efficiency factor YidD n=1 Tax=Yaniella flava TaxID=287930 RepID=UPI0031DCB4D0
MKNSNEHEESHSGSQPSPFIVKDSATEWGFLRALPSTIVGWLLRAYRKVISPSYGDVCKFFPTCSAYGLEAVYTHGAVKGSLMAGRRVLSCHPWQDGGIDPVPPGNRIWPDGKQPFIIELNHPVIPPDVEATEEDK